MSLSKEGCKGVLVLKAGSFDIANEKCDRVDRGLDGEVA